jgi:hypothetical protein
MTGPESSAALARAIADKMAHGGGIPADVHAATGQIYALLAVIERLDAIASRLDRIADRLGPAPAQPPDELAPAQPHEPAGGSE